MRVSHLIKSPPNGHRVKCVGNKILHNQLSITSNERRFFTLITENFLNMMKNRSSCKCSANKAAFDIGIEGYGK